MSSAISTRSAITIAALTAVGGLVAYAAYFDYKRRNDAEFRKRLRKEKKRVQRSQPAPQAAASSGHSQEEIKEALLSIRGEQLPVTADDKEQYFMDNVSNGERLCAQGPLFEIPAALAFYRALRVYPSPVDLIMIYQKTVPDPVFKLVMEMTSMEVRERAEGYYDVFPDASYNVGVKPLPRKDGVSADLVMKQVLVAKKSFKAGEVIYKEQPVVATLDSDLEGTGKYCSQCFKIISGDEAIRPQEDPLDPTYCSKECQERAAAEHHTTLFSASGAKLTSSAPEEPSDPAKVEVRKAAQQALVDHVKTSEKHALLLIAKFIGRMVAAEARKLAGTPDSSPYSLYDHLERLRFLEITGKEWEAEAQILSSVLKNSAEGLEEFIRDERYRLMLGKFAYNVIGVNYDGGRDDKPESKFPVEEREWTRTSEGTHRQIGSGLYFVSSYMAHSCAPTVRLSFDGTNELHVIAEQDIAEGDELTMAYVDVKLTGDNVIESRRNRRHHLARGWRFACSCDRCAAEAPVLVVNTTTPADDVEVTGPAAKAEAAVERFETGQDGPEFRVGVPEPGVNANDDIE